MLAAYLRKTGWKRFCVMVIGNVFVGMGLGLFKMSSMGNAPYDGMNMAISAVTGVYYPTFQVLMNIALFVVQLAAGRKFIGIGTIVNAVFLGYIGMFFYNLFGVLCGWPETFAVRLLTVGIGVVVVSLGLSMYQQSDVGVAPYDSLALILDRRLPKVPYFWCRMLTDCTCALICFLFGGIIGIGTVATMFGFGPVIHFFDSHLTKKILGTDK
ncbi:MAG: hypothetical protein LUD01_02195 [Clostridiales bacterium]|nr:hypothetical protein [Clostridiales bacterium]